jgi:hypothetical protein
MDIYEKYKDIYQTAHNERKGTTHYEYKARYLNVELAALRELERLNKLPKAAREIDLDR